MCLEPEKRNVCLVRSAQSIWAADCLPANKGRASMVHSLIDAFNLDKLLTIKIPQAATDDELARFHSEEYVRAACSSASIASEQYDDTSDDEYDDDDDDDDNNYNNNSQGDSRGFGLEFDCAVFDQMEQHVRYIAGGTICAARTLVEGNADIAINWEGGRHHAGRSKAAGFCFVNDIVLGILVLQQRFSRVLYVDLDLHHGDGVQNAFLYSSSVMTLSFHHAERGFYPNSGMTSVEGKGKGTGYSINIALKRGASDSTFVSAFSRISEILVPEFQPDAVVLQCGCDGLAGDPHKIFNLTPDAFVQCLKLAIAWNRPLMLLGGGGYNHADSARCWTRITAAACGADISADQDIPDHRFYTEYPPAFDMRVDAMLLHDENTQKQLDEKVSEIKSLGGF
ncbi:Histone deacetylase 8 [Coemansia asiatica]|uniref:Histone deacetylase n=1 Tax=Coemansia asiatica TaxID=1052880 RepID=A0A9W8CKK1_9FUNG|nr:Histone deacetylase 8 [Coemansia asiatica]